jgi:predicted DNA-binding transcriptional regulator AlpA
MSRARIYKAISEGKTPVSESAGECSFLIGISRKSRQNRANNERRLHLMSERLLRLPQVLERIPVSKSSWWQGIRDGRFPAPVKLGPRTSAWREADIDAICEQTEGAGHE